MTLNGNTVIVTAMGNHGTPRGEESTYRANGGKETIPYKGQHRKGETPAGYHLGKNPNRVTKEQNEFESGRNANDRDRTDR